MQLTAKTKWVEIMPGVWQPQEITPEQKELRCLLTATPVDKPALRTFLQDLADQPYPHTMREAGAKFLLEL